MEYGDDGACLAGDLREDGEEAMVHNRLRERERRQMPTGGLVRGGENWRDSRDEREQCLTIHDCLDFKSTGMGISRSKPVETRLT
jgi:hypothetical protein